MYGIRSFYKGKMTEAWHETEAELIEMLMDYIDEIKADNGLK